MTTGRVLGQFSDYAGMLSLVRARVRELEVAGEAFDQFAGLPIGYLSKLVGENPIRRVGANSLGPLFNALGIYCIVVEDLEATERLRKRLKPRNQSFVRASSTVHAITDRKWARTGAWPQGAVGENDAGAASKSRATT